VPARVSEGIVLRTYPFQEADLVVSFLTRDQGKLRGVARRARRPKSAFGSGLERLSQVKMSYYQRETRELVNLNSCELIRSQFGLVSDYRAGVALDYVAEVAEQLLPPAEPNERFFRLIVAVLDHMQSGGSVWRAATYFTLWAVRLAGFLPSLTQCAGCGAGLEEKSFFSRGFAGLVCETCRGRPGAGSWWELSGASRAIACAALRSPVAELGPPEWRRETAADLRRWLVGQIETHVERRLLTAPVLEAE
jgi:DNA repair protein RecO (recombination protein O)